MTNETQNNPQQQKQNPAGSPNPADKSRNNPSHGDQDPQDRKQDIYKKNPSQDTDPGRNEEEQEPGQEKRRAS